MLRLENGRFVAIPHTWLRLFTYEYFYGRCGAVLNEILDPDDKRGFELFRCPACRLKHFQHPEWGLMSSAINIEEFSISAILDNSCGPFQAFVCMHQSCGGRLGILTGVCEKCKTEYSGWDKSGRPYVLAKIDPNDPRGYKLIN